VETWIDRDRHGWVHVGFSDDVEARQADIAARFPGEGIVAVLVPYAERELREVRRRVADLMGRFNISGHGIAFHKGVVNVRMTVLEPADIAEITERFLGDPICLSGTRPEDVPPDVPQPIGGDGWRLLAFASDQPGLGAYRTGIAFDQASYDALWAESGLAPPASPVDFETEVAIWFAAVGSGGCELRLDDVVVDPARALVHGEFVSTSLLPCVDIPSSRTFMVALARDRLPAGPFAIQLSGDDPQGVARRARTIVEVDLSAPGSVAAPGEVHPDEAVVDPGPRTVRPGGIAEPGFEPLFAFPVDCGVEWLGPLNDVWWRTADPEATGGRLPAAWADAVEDGELTAVISMHTGPASLDVTVGTRTVTYVPVAEGPPACQ
jgi:hypothetical protein